MKFAVSACLAMGLLAGAAAAQNNSGIVDVYIAKIKPEKRGDFDAIARKVADANRKAKGDHWLALSVEYGEQNTVMMSSVRENFAAIDSGVQSFEAALKEGFGPTWPKLFQDMSNCLVSSRSEIRRRRLDLSRNVPANQEDIYKVVGASRFARMNVVRIRSGHIAEFEESMKTMKAAMEQPNGRPFFVSQVIAGDRSGTFYIISYGKNMGDFETPTRSLREVLGESGYDQYQKVGRDAVITSETMIARLVPDLSNPPEGMVNADPAFWRPVRKMPATPAKQAVVKSGD